MMFLHWLFRGKHTELKLVLATLGFLLLMPMLAVTVVASTGIEAASAAIASLNPVTRQVDVFDANGTKLDTITLTTVWPTRGYVSDEFGTHDPIRKELRLGSHTGIDIAHSTGKLGEPVTTFMEGTVIAVDGIGLGTCGEFVRVQHENDIQSIYCHLLTTKGTKVGDEVVPGTVIGLMGSSGVSTGAHTHFQINVSGIPVNPRTFLMGEPEPSTVR